MSKIDRFFESVQFKPRKEKKSSKPKLYFNIGLLLLLLLVFTIFRCYNYCNPQPYIIIDHSQADTEHYPEQ